MARVAIAGMAVTTSGPPTKECLLLLLGLPLMGVTAFLFEANLALASANLNTIRQGWALLSPAPYTADSY